MRIDEHLLETIDEFRPFLFLEGWDFTIVREKIEDDDGDFTFMVKARFPYREAVISYHKRAEKLYRKERYDELNAKLLHEMVHVIVAPLSLAGQQKWQSEENYTIAEEQVVDHLTEVIWSLLH